MAVRVHLEGDGLLYDDETTVFQAAQIIGFLKNNEALATSGAVATNTTLLGVSSPKQSPRAALQESNAKTNAQKIAALGCYVAEQNNHESFELEEVKIAFRKAGEPLPKNFSRDARDAVTANLIYEDDGQYVLTEYALEQIKNGFTDTERKQNRTAKKTTARRNGSGAKVVMNEELLQTLNQHGDSLKDYISSRSTAFSNKTSNQVAIIACWLKDELKWDGMAPSDLQAVRRYLGQPGGNAYSQISNATAREGYFSHSRDGKFFLSGKGEDFGRITAKV